MRLPNLIAFAQQHDIAQPGAKVVSAGALAAQMASMFLEAGFLVYTLFPAMIGAGIHTVLRALDPESSLTRLDILVVSVIALFTGIYGGPYIAAVMPATKEGLPLFCFFAALWAKDVGVMIKDVAQAAAKKMMGPS